jgi:ethanolaminephosphotransferase
LRVARRWNQTGQKFAGSPDIARDFLCNHTTFLWILVGITYLWNLNTLVTVVFAPFGQLLAGTIGSALTTAALTFKLAFTNEDSPELLSDIARAMAGVDSGISLVTRARIIFLAVGVTLIMCLTTGLRKPLRANHKTNSLNMGIAFSNSQHATAHSIHALLSLVLITQSRATNIPLILLFSIQSYFLSSLNLSVVDVTTTSILLQQASFFIFGNSNAISSIDLSNAYNGVSGYNVLAVGALTFVSNWAGPLFWASATTLLLLKLDRQGTKDVLLQHLTLQTAFTASSIVFVMVTCTILRTHLFIWTVFSPKYLYSMAWSLGQHLCINVSFGTVLFWLGKHYQEVQDRQVEVEHNSTGKNVPT